MKKEYNQQPGESFEDWKFRLILGKRDGTVDMTWPEIGKALGLNLNSESMRKFATGITAYRDYMKSKNQLCLEETPQSSIDAIDDKRFELEREKMRMQDQKRELNKEKREWARAEHLMDEVAKAVREMKPLQFQPCKCVDEKLENEGILLLSDWHVGMCTDNFDNTFNDTVLHERVMELVEKTIRYGLTHDVSTMHVFCLGDLINGLIHVTTRIKNEEDAVRQTMHAAELVAYVLGRLSEEFPDVRVYFSRGNHDRVSANVKESIPRESFSDLIEWYIKARLAENENVRVFENDVDDEIIVANICGQTVFAVHGHKDKPQKAVQNLSLALKTFPDYVFMGHFHAAAEQDVQGAEVVVNGCLCGTDDYAKKLRKVSKPTQKFMVFNDEGRLCTYNIFLGGR